TVGPVLDLIQVGLGGALPEIMLGMVQHIDRRLARIPRAAGRGGGGGGGGGGRAGAGPRPQGGPRITRGGARFSRAPAHPPPGGCGGAAGRGGRGGGGRQKGGRAVGGSRGIGGNSVWGGSC